MWLNRHNYVRLYLILAALCAQDAAIRVDVQQVLVPVVVTDKKGHYVSGLRAADFQIFEDGMPQQIASFSSAAEPAARHTFVICIDTLHASAAGAVRVREALENLLEKEKPGDAQYVLIGIGRQLQVLQPATSNPAALLVKVRSAAFQNAMAGMDASALAAQLQQVRSRMGEFCKQCSCGMRSGQANCDSQIDALKQSVDAEAERWAAPTKALLDQFKSVVEELAKLPNGRTLILISDGFEINPKPEFYAAVSAYLPNRPQFKAEESTSGLREAVQVASDRNVVIFTIDSRGAAQASLESTGAMDAGRSLGSGGGDPIGMGSRSRQAPAATRTAAGMQTNPFGGLASASMEELARSTGGVYSHDNGALLKQLRGALADGRQYYLLSYVPKNAAHDGKFRIITVETSDKKLNLRAKAGYWAVAAQ
jgi:VWFA-related protein